MTTDVSIGVDDPGVDVPKIIADIQTRVAERIKDGAYTDPRIARAERYNLANLRSHDEFFDAYIQCLRDAVLIDINDFEIKEWRRGIGSALVLLKRAIWTLLKYYTYRLWSQQNQVNSMMLALSEELDDRYKRRIEALEARVRDLESKRDPTP